jgi:sugar lactone lactonase YvrE
MSRRNDSRMPFHHSLVGRPRWLPTLVAALVALALFSVGCGDDEAPPQPPVPEAPGTISTWAGTGIPGWGTGDGRPLVETDLYEPIDLTFTSSGDVYIVDWQNHAIRHATPGGVVETVIGDQAGFPGDGPEFGSGESDLVPPGAPGDNVYLNHPTHVLEMPDHSILVTCWHNHKLRHFDPATGLVLVQCGRGAGYGGDGGPFAAALLNQPMQTALGPDGSRYVLDQRNQRIRKISPSDTITTVVGTGVRGYFGDGDSPLVAQINQPFGTNPQPGGSVVFDSQGRLYFSDVLNNRVRRVDFSMDLIETVAGNGVAAFGGDGDQATSASLNNPRDLAFGPDGRLYIADELNNRVRAVDLTTGIITTVAGNGLIPSADDNWDIHDGGPATEARLNRPAGLDFDADGNLYIVDSYNHRIRRVAH